MSIVSAGRCCVDSIRVYYEWMASTLMSGWPRHLNFSCVSNNEVAIRAVART